MMKRICALGIAITLVFFVSCGKQQTEAEKNAEIERQVQQRIAAERQADEQQKLAQREADLKAREDALAQKEQEPEQTATPQMRGSDVQQREVEPQVEPSGSEETASYNTFYTKLEPYGAWRETSDYGYVWQPNETQRSANWRPYTNGRWVYTDAGWTWDSEEAFGWATYHYGRWAKLRNVGWVWIPGDEWAPAWVSWRTGGDYVGWAPLPPEAQFDRRTGIHNWADNSYDIGPDQYCFVPQTDFGDRRIEHTIVPVERNVTIVNQTINVTNITYSNTTVVSQGPNFDELRKRSRQPIERLRLDRRQRFEKADQRAVVRGEVIQMSAPAIVRGGQAERPRTVKEKIAQPVVDRGWEGIRDKGAAKKAREKMKAEATPPAGMPLPRNVATQPQPTAVPVQAAETPVRNFPQRDKMKPHASATVPPGVVATPSPIASRPPQDNKDAQRKMKEAERAQKEKALADQKAAQQKKMEEQRKAKAAERHPQSPAPIKAVTPRPTPLVKPTPRAVAVSPTPAAVVRKPVAPTAPPQKPMSTPAAAPSAVSSPTGGGEDVKKDAKERRKDKRDRQNPSPSPTATAR